MKKIIFTTIFISLFSLHANAEEKFSISSSSFKDGEMLKKYNEFNGFGCDGKNIMPDVKWANAPKDTKSFALTVYDPDAPTGSGWWHLVSYDIPKETKAIKNANFPKNTIFGKNDAGEKTYMGPCPPKASGDHHYAFTIFALNVEKLNLPESASAAYIGYTINAHKIDSAKITGIYKRD